MNSDLDSEVAEARLEGPALSRYNFVTGAAGSGKTTLVREWCAGDPHMKLCATTGIAAVNLGDAVTINSMLGYYNTQSLRDAFVQGWIQTRLRRNRSAGITRYVLDEVSMLEADALGVLVMALEDCNNEASVLMGDEPEIGLTLVGDFLQLPPVHGDYAFEAPQWDEHFAGHVLTLTTMYRQADPTFLTALRAVRVGDAGTALDILRGCFVTGADMHFAGSSIYSKNQQVDRYNRLRHQRIPTKPILFPSTQMLKEGEKAPGYWEQIPPIIALRPGALVTILVNKTDKDSHDEEAERYMVYANGDLGEFLGTATDQPTTAVVRLHRTGETVNVGYHVRQHAKLTKGKREIVSEIKYMPLRLAYATTVHKSQGLTLDAVQLDINDPFWAQPAMLYVGVSRARNLEGLRIVGRPEMLQHRCTFDPRVARWR